MAYRSRRSKKAWSNLSLAFQENQAHPDLGVVVIEARTDVLALLFADHVHQGPVFPPARPRPALRLPNTQGWPPRAIRSPFRVMVIFVNSRISFSYLSKASQLAKFTYIFIVPYGTDEGNRK
jgi:hypothetical protein